VKTRTRSGCRSPEAVNYDPTAVYSAGCVFPPTPVSGAGGTVAFSGLGVQLAVPPGAVAAAGGSSVGITVSEVDVAVLLQAPKSAATAASGNATGSSSSGGEDVTRVLATTVFDFGPDGTSFLAPVRVCVAVNLSQVEAYGWGVGGQADAAGGNTSLALYWSSNATGGGNWTLADPSTFDAVTGQLCGTLWHFTCEWGEERGPMRYAACLVCSLPPLL
jgi:hypothetical protein